MSQPPRNLTPLRSAWDRLGAELRHRRTSRALSQRELGELTHHSAALIGKVEKAQRRPSRDLVRRLDEALDADGALERLWRRAATELPTASDVTHPEGHAPGRRGLVGQADIDGLTVMAKAFADADHRCGGTHVRSALAEYLASTVQPTLARECPAQLRPALHTAAAQVLDVAGFTAFDSGDHGTAQRHYGQALDLLSAADNPVMTGHVLTDLAMLALEHRRPRQAVDHAQAAVEAARTGGSLATEARALAVLGRAHAGCQDIRSCRRTLDQARDVLDVVDRPGEPEWVAFFTAQQWATESVYALADAAGQQELEDLADPVLRHPGGMHRRRLLLAATLAISYCRRDGASGSRDLDRAANLVIKTVRSCGSITSARALARIDEVRSAVRTAGARSLARQLDDVVDGALPN